MRKIYVLEHALQLGCELAAALSLELGDHGLLSIVAGAPPQEQPLCQIFFIECFEHILSLQTLFA